MAFKVPGANFFVLLLLFATGESAIVYSEPRAANRTENSPKKWITELFQEAEISFHIASTASTTCKQDFATYREHLKNQSEWAVRMTESSHWPSAGFLSGTMDHMGNWVECTTTTSQKGINGQYCLVSANYEFTRDFSDALASTQNEDVESSAWNRLQKYKKQPWKSNRQVVKWAICVPNSCQADDIQVSLEKTLQPLFHRQNLDISVSVTPNTCSKHFRENWWKDYEKGNTLFWTFTKCIIALTVFSTVYHSVTNEEDEKKSGSKSISNEIMTSFSIIRNYRDLTLITPEDIPSVYFAKIIFMFFIVLGHRILFFYSYPFYNSEVIEKELYSEGSMLIGLFYSGFIMVEAFFMFSGFVSFTAHLAKTKVKGWCAVVEDLLYRWAKMIPLHMYMLFIIIYVMPTLNDGPIWYRTMNEADRCSTNLWSNFFAVSNIFGKDKMCMFHTWYPSVDIQLTVIGSIILVLYARNEKLGTYITILAFAAGTAYSFIHTYINKYHGALPMFISTLYTGRNTEEFLNSYISTSTRISSYLVGFAFGIITKKLAEIKFKFSEGSIFVMFILDLCSKAAIIFYIPQLCEFTKPYNRLENAISAAIIRSLFVLPEAFLCLAYAGTRKCKYLAFFDSTIWVPLGRLLYGVFVVSVVIQYYHSVSHQVLMPSFSLIYIFWLFVGDIIYSIFGAFVLFLLLQAPVFNLLKIIIRQSMRKMLTSLKAAKLRANETKQSIDKVKHNKKL